MLFRDRHDAALRLIPQLEKYRKENGVVMAIPRGGVPIGYYIARHNNMPLDLMLTKKIGHPLNPEVAIGAVSLEDYEVQEHYIVPPSYIDTEVKKISDALHRQYRMYAGDQHHGLDLKGKTILLIDDGVATGNTIITAARIIRKKNPAKIIVAVPVAAPGAVARISEVADELVCLHTPERFLSVSEFYVDFSQVPDEEVARLLKNANSFGSAA
jgi:putative phosphoribosyl transferase